MMMMPWIFRDCFSNGKIRVRERYYRYTLDQTKYKNAVIPDALTLRIYTPLLQELLKANYYIIITESAVEYMDYRNQMGEKAGERSRLQKWIASGEAIPFCDLSVREETDDEFTFMKYEQMDVETRSKLALVRAAKLIGDDSAIILTEDDTQPGEDVRVMSITEFLQHAATVLSIDDETLERLQALQKACYDKYVERNRSAADSAVEVTLTEDEVEQGLKLGQLYKGRLEVSKENIREGYVKVGTESWFIDLHKGHNRRSIHRDQVVIQPFPEAEWGRPVGKRRLVHQSNENDDEDDFDRDVDIFPPAPSARVVAVLDSPRRKYVATLIDSPSADESAVLVVPMDICIPKIRIQTHSWQSFVGKRLLCEIDCWNEDSKYPQGRVVDIMGDIGNLETEIAALMRENMIYLEDFSVAAMSCLPVQGESWKVPEIDIQNRRDLRESRRVFSVDPPGCQDIDDTMHAEVLPNGDIEIGVHIADVTAFLDKDSALDLEAQERGTTFYLVDRRFDMLPTLLSSNLCSLHAKVARLAVSVIWTLSPDFVEKSCWFGRTVIKNCASMTYDQAEKIMAGASLLSINPQTPHPDLTAGGPVDKGLVPCIKEDLVLLTNLARRLRSRREANGAVDLSGGEGGSELKFELVGGVPTVVKPKEEKEIHHTIAELMILANRAVAEKIFESFPNISLLRSHRSMSLDRLRALERIFGEKGLDSSHLNRLLKNAEKSIDKSIFSLVKSETTRAMTEALYLRSGSSGRDEDLSHFGLGLKFYTHFTSPIRRYADVIVHRQLLLLTGGRIKRSFESKDVRLRLQDVPESVIPSVLGEEVVDQLTETTENLQLNEVKGSTSVLESSPVNKAATVGIYSSEKLDSICENLNLKNRSEVHKAVVMEARDNGFIAYVPRFDLNTPVYLMDKDGCIQMDPQLFGLKDDSGLEATKAFTSSPYSRWLGTGSIHRENGSLTISIPSSTQKKVINEMEVVTLHLTCNNWDESARVPQIRANLIRDSAPLLNEQQNTSSTENYALYEESVSKGPSTSRDDIYRILVRQGPSRLNASPRREIVANLGQQGILQKRCVSGRLICNAFVNPNTREAFRSSAQEALLHDREARGFPTQTKTNLNDMSATTRELTARQQRIAAAKRNARKSKQQK